jgi:uncharacterized OsmC-like protein
MSNETVRARIGQEKYRTEMSVRGHLALADEPTDLDGQDTGPTPGDYMCMALAACKTITMRMYADRKEWPLTAADVEVHHERVKAEDLGEAGAELSGLVSRFNVKIKLEGNLDEDQVKRLKHIAGRCPVHRTLESSSVIHTD